jgi:hypothetical protein
MLRSLTKHKIFTSLLTPSLTKTNIFPLLSLQHRFNGTADDAAFTKPLTDLQGKNPIVITKEAANRIKYLNQKKNLPNRKLRVVVESGGCSGLMLNFSMTEKVEENDL